MPRLMIEFHVAINKYKIKTFVGNCIEHLIHALVNGPTPMHIWAVLIELMGLLITNLRTYSCEGDRIGDTQES